MDQARQSRQIFLFEPDFIKNKNQIGRFLNGSYLPARFVWIDTIFCGSLSSFFFSIFGCLKQYISGISCGWILKDVFQHSNEPEKWFTNEGKRKWRCWRLFIVFTKFLLDLSDITWGVTDQLKRQGRGQVTLLLSSFFTFTAHIKLVSQMEKALSTIHTFPCNTSHQIFDFLWDGISFNVTW